MLRRQQNGHLMSIRSFENHHPSIADSAYVDPSAEVIGNVNVGEHASIWPGVVIRGDVHEIRIGPETNIQDGVICHCTSPKGEHPGWPLLVGARVTVGHGAILHACEIGDECLIGMRATVMDGAIVKAGAFVGANTLVPPGKILEGGFLWLGAPARKVRPLSEEEIVDIRESAAHYVRVATRHKG